MMAGIPRKILFVFYLLLVLIAFSSYFMLWKTGHISLLFTPNSGTNARLKQCLHNAIDEDGIESFESGIERVRWCFDKIIPFRETTKSGDELWLLDRRGSSDYQAPRDLLKAETNKFVSDETTNSSPRTIPGNGGDDLDPAKLATATKTELSQEQGAQITESKTTKLTTSKTTKLTTSKTTKLTTSTTRKLPTTTSAPTTIPTKTELTQEQLHDRDRQETQTTTTTTIIKTKLPALIDKESTQKCRIPYLDPFHREAMPYITYKWTEKCYILQNETQINKDGRLVVNTKGWTKIKLKFFEHETDAKNSYNEYEVFDKEIATSDKEGLLELDMKTDFIEVQFERPGRKSSEWHVYPVRQLPPKSDPPFQMYSEKKDKFNVLMIMLDSFSHASGQRYLPKTYRFLQNNPNSVIMKGHTVVGDATTPQLSAMFFGAQPEELKPEGRRGHKAAQRIDGWPSIFKDYKQSGYCTLFSEDDCGIGAFNFRLMGFDKPPTNKYLRPWWIETRDLKLLNESRADSCPTHYHLAYLKDFYGEYSNELSFSFFSNSGITHGTPEKAFSIDDEFVDLFRHMNETGKLDSTIIVLFGDHGSRATAFRATNQGKMEERLPLMTFTFPPRFHKEFPEEMKTIKRNAQVLTTPYDMHVTLKHLLAITETPPKHQFGRSLFTDIVKLNRTCKDTGVPPWFCICTQFEPVDPTDPIVGNIASQMVGTINEIVSNFTLARNKCERLKLDRVVRASRMVQQDEHKKGFDSFEITFTVTPSGGLFESTAEHDQNNNKTQVNHNFSRINLYGNQPKCIAQLYPHLRKFCYCKS